MLGKPSRHTSYFQIDCKLVNRCDSLPPPSWRVRRVISPADMQMNIYSVQANYLHLLHYFSQLFFWHCQEGLYISWLKHSNNNSVNKLRMDNELMWVICDHGLNQTNESAHFCHVAIAHVCAYSSRVLKTCVLQLKNPKYFGIKHIKRNNSLRFMQWKL